MCHVCILCVKLKKEKLGLCIGEFVDCDVNVIEEYQCNMSDKYKMRKIDMLKRSGKENECYVDE